MYRWKKFARDFELLMQRAEISIPTLDAPPSTTNSRSEENLDSSLLVRDWAKIHPLLEAAQRALGHTEVDLRSWRRRWDEVNGDVQRFRYWGGSSGGGGGSGETSDRALKRDVRPTTWTNDSEQVKPSLEDGNGVNGFALLKALENLPTSTWRYDWEDPQIRHLGPMAQDWYETFGLGNDNTTIAPVDVAGVLITAIQALTQKIHSLEQEVSHLKRK